MATAVERREALKRIYLDEARDCVRCPLAESRTRVVFGAGDADADLMFVGEAPGRNEDEAGLPFVGQAGKLLDRLLSEVGLERGDVFVANVLKCLRDTAQVQLADGSWERIGRLVRSRYPGSVMSVDDSGRLVPRRVIGWHATPVGGRGVYRLSYRSAKGAGHSRVGVELTGDHPVLTERGYIRADALTGGDRVATGQGLSPLAHDVVCGTLLGDGCLPSASSCLTFGHSRRQRDYALFKAHLLAELSPRHEDRMVAGVAGGSPAYAVVHVRTLAQRALRTLRRDFYRERKCVPPWMAESLNARMLAFWFMDDGYTRIRAGRQPLSEIATNAFDSCDLRTLVAGLLRIGLRAKARRGRLFFDVHATEKVSELIAPYVPPSMRYKLHPEVERRVPFHPDHVRPGPPEVMFDEVEVENLTDKPRADTTFFCIDVEENHNFVTAGGVVHNCRPPGNRDPQPGEIDACQDYLRRQVELIEPKVVCTLGNFATKLLRGDPSGITRVHGQSEVAVIGERAVRLYPLFHPAAALYTPSTLDTLREDFARIPALLGEPAPEVPPAAAIPAPAIEEPAAAAEPEPEPEQASSPAPARDEQMGLF